MTAITLKCFRRLAKFVTSEIHVVPVLLPYGATPEDTAFCFASYGVLNYIKNIPAFSFDLFLRCSFRKFARYATVSLRATPPAFEPDKNNGRWNRMLCLVVELEARWLQCHSDDTDDE